MAINNQEQSMKTSWNWLIACAQTAYEIHVFHGNGHLERVYEKLSFTD